MTDQYYVIGNPIAHSKSPEIHHQFAQQTDQTMCYERFQAPLGEFASAFTGLVESGVRGANVTVPFKQDAFLYCDAMSGRATRAGAVNTLMIKENGSCYGDNTDGVGLLADLVQNHAVTLLQKRVLVLGAGGAVRGVLAPLLAENPACVVIANRTPGKAHALADDFADLGVIQGCGFDELEKPPFDLIINGTSAGLQGDVPPIAASLLCQGGVTYDMVYSHTPTAFVQWGERAGARLALDGLGMLVEQAAAAFYLWRGQHPDTRPVIQALR